MLFSGSIIERFLYPPFSSLLLGAQIGIGSCVSSNLLCLFRPGCHKVAEGYCTGPQQIVHCTAVQMRVPRDAKTRRGCLDILLNSATQGTTLRAIYSRSFRIRESGTNPNWQCLTWQIGQILTTSCATAVAIIERLTLLMK